jgi:hypothetical protein
MITLIETPLRVRVRRIIPNQSLEWVTEKLERWAARASGMYGMRHIAIVETDIDEARKHLSAEGLMFEQIRDFCIDNQTLTLYYTCRETRGRVNILGLYGFSLVDYTDLR